MEEWNSSSNSVDNYWSDVDTATVVSIGSSCVILISGCIAVVCLILYMKKSEQQIQRHIQSPNICSKCGIALNERRSIGVLTEEALYAITPIKDDARVICGHVSDTQTTYSTNINIKPQCSHSQCSSELIYEISRPFESFDVYECVSETPTDPGIRQFTESPPKPNERRQGVVQHNLEQFGAIPRFRSRQPMWKLSSESQTIKCLSSLSELQSNGLSSGGESDEDFTAIDC